ncbi:uncharacterized protein LOC103698490 [Phoenix dactylifera]|uniref:Uncharacterized protein LOC103698490 n=1 Tax=Phoenix dactylifera TaxID=42345 RepID=A0A8B8ZHM8_PHODC|nr:uncharacterized protein LOC103698490 [Phoenix dactylifera]XP_038973670.1 uncharacterized protein LOC103698490 [Phoenix dactylifera]
MAVYIRAKRVTDPLDDKVKARIRGDDRFMTGYASSGSEHDALSGLVHAFLESGGPSSPTASAVAAASDDGEESDSEDGDRSVEAATKVKELLDPSGKGELFRLRLLAGVSEAAEAMAELRWSRSAYRRAVMVRLREGGYNAGICKARWESSGGLTAGSYEYIDVVVDAAEEVAVARYIVDVGFAAEFEVARATEEYGRMVAALPRVMVARPEEVRQVVLIAAEAVRRSLRRRGMHVPPWRKGRYMLAKWLGPYRRTVNLIPAAAGAAVAGVGEAKCRAVGFRAVSPGAVSPATRTQ